MKDVALKDSDGIISEHDRQAYLLVISRAFDIYLDREAVRKGLWKEYPCIDQGNQIKVKIDRVLRSLERLPSIKEDDPLTAQLRDNIDEELLDIINYAVFAHILNPKIAHDS